MQRTKKTFALWKQKLVYARMSKEDQLRYDRRLESLSNEKEAMRESEIQGIEKGEKIGIKKGRAEGEKIGLEKGEKIGLEKGEKIGIEKGVKQKAIDMARKLKAKGLMSAEEIADISGLTESEISNL